MFPAFLLWPLGGALLLSLVKLFKRFWDKLDDSTKELIIEEFIKHFEEILRAYYRWWKQKGDKSDDE
jgi:hypothetical protein